MGAAQPTNLEATSRRHWPAQINRLISRTVCYALIAGLLIGVYVCLVTFATRVLPFSTPVAVAASTLAVVALFNPLRRRLQPAIDRRFNRPATTPTRP